MKSYIYRVFSIMVCLNIIFIHEYITVLIFVICTGI